MKKKEVYEGWQVFEGAIDRVHFQSGIVLSNNPLIVFDRDTDGPKGKAYFSLLSWLQMSPLAWFQITGTAAEHAAFIYSLNADILKFTYGVPKDGVMVFDLKGAGGERTGHYMTTIGYELPGEPGSADEWYKREERNGTPVTLVKEKHNSRHPYELAQMILDRRLNLNQVFVIAGDISTKVSTIRGATNSVYRGRQ